MTPVIDLHCDTLSKLICTPSDFFLPSGEKNSHVSFFGLQSAHVLLQCFALFTDLYDLNGELPLSHIQKQLSCFETILTESKGKIKQVSSYPDIVSNQRQGAISALLTLEECCLSENVLSLLPTLYSYGVRITTLTWNYPNLLASPASDITSSLPPKTSHPSYLSNLPRTHGGLTPLGFEFVAEAERLGITIDVSHLSVAGFYDVAAHSTKPFLASHSNAGSICDVPRNLSDDMLRTLAEHGGVVGLNLHEPFLIPSFASPEELLCAFVRHVKHIISVAGIDTLALGTDFDGIPGNAAIPDITYLSRLENALEKAGLSSGEVEKIFYRNALQFFENVL